MNMVSVLDLSPQEYANFIRSMKFVLKWETADGRRVYVNDPDDPGGETKYGIAARYHPDKDIKNLTLDEACNIYLNEYWRPAMCHTLYYPDCLVIFDTAVNLGPGRALKFVGQEFNWEEYLDRRKEYYIEKVKETPKKQKFLGGWLNRLADLRKLVETYYAGTD